MGVGDANSQLCGINVAGLSLKRWSGGTGGFADASSFLDGCLRAVAALERGPHGQWMLQPHRYPLSL